MSSVDKRIVKMEFDNASFKTKAGETKQALTDVDAAVAKAGKGRGLLDMAGHMDAVKIKASAMQVAAVTAIATIANKAVTAGISMAKSLSLDPILDGFNEYELKMKSIQTILANTSGENLRSVSSALEELNTYSDKTIYNFANMTQNIGKLTTAGISLEDATSTVKGFSNMVALAGGDATAAAGAMEQFGQGLQAGAIKLIDWKSLQTRGLGSQSLQKAFFETARAAGSLKDVPLDTTFEQWSKAQGGFNQSLESGWLTTDVAVQTMGIMTGDIKDAQELIAMGFDPKTADDMLKIANNALESATKVRTFTAFMGTLKEQIGSGWAQIMEIVIGDFDEATNLFSGLSDLTGKAIGNFFGYIGALLKGWDEMGGRVAILNTIKNLLAPIGAIIKVVGAAWQAAFPSKKTGSGLALASKGLEALTSPLAILAKLISKSTPTITGFFRVLGIAGELAKRAGKYIGEMVQRLFGVLKEKMPSVNTGGMIDFIKNLAKAVGDAIEQAADLIKKGEGIKDVFSNMKFDMPELPSWMKGESKSENPVSAFFAGRGLLAPKDSFDQFEKEKSGGMFNPDAKIDTSRVKDIGSGGLNSIQAEADKAGGILAKMEAGFSALVDKIKGFFAGFNVDDLVATINLAVLGTFLLSISRFLDKLGGSFEGFAGLGESMKGAFDSVGEGLKSLQTKARAQLITAIAIAIGILVASLWVLSKIPQDKLTTSLIALSAVAAILKVVTDSMGEILAKMEGAWSGAKLIALGITMMFFAAAVLILAYAFSKFADLPDWGGVQKGSVAMGLLVGSMYALSRMKKEDLAQAAAALVIVSVALLIFAKAIRIYEKIDTGVFINGMIKIAAALAVLTIALHAFESSIKGAIALGVVVGVLWLLTKIIDNFVAIDDTEFGNAMIKIAIALGILVVAMSGFQSSIAGAIALAIVVASLWLFVEVVEALSNMDWKAFGKGMLMVVIALVALGAALALFGFFSPFILAGAAALLVFGIAIALVGAGILFLTTSLAALTAISALIVPTLIALGVGAAMGFTTFLQTVAAQAPVMKKAVLDILQVMIDTIVEAVPMIIDGVQRLVKAVWETLTKPEEKENGKKAGKDMVNNVAGGLEKETPTIADKAVRMAKKFIKALSDRAASLGGVAADFISKFINGIANNIGKIVDSGVNLVLKFLEGMGKNAVRLARGAADVLIDFLNGLEQAIRDKMPKLIDAGMGIADALVDGVTQGITDYAHRAIDEIASLGAKMVAKAKSVLKIWSPSRVFRDIGKFIAEGLTIGVQNNAKAAIIAVASMVGGQIAIASEYISEFIQDLEQKTLAATAKAVGLQKAADRAMKAAKKTKTKEDDKAAKKLQRQADRASEEADRENKKLEARKAKEKREAEFEKASSLEKAQIKSKEAQASLDRARNNEFKAAAKREEAAALDRAAKAKGLSEKERKAMRARAKELRRQARKDAINANKALEEAKKQAESALEWQTKAGDEASKSYQDRFDQDAKDAKEEAEFEKMTDAQKAQRRREQAIELQRLSQENLEKAKKLAYTDVEAANKLAAEALEQADKARDYFEEAEELGGAGNQGTNQSGTITGGTVVDTSLSDTASVAYSRYSEMYDSATAALAAGDTIFTQHNYSPEALSDVEIYRQTKNLFTAATAA